MNEVVGRMKPKSTQLGILVFLVYAVTVSFCQVEPVEHIGVEESNPAYQTFTDFFACKRLVSTEGPIGCGSERDGSRGKLFGILSNADLEGFLENNALTERAIYLDSTFFNASILSSLIDTNRVSALLVKPAGSAPASFSPAPVSTFSAGDGLSSLLIPFPVILLSPNRTEAIESRIQSNIERGYEDKTWQHAVEIDFYNGKTTADSQFCLDNDRCDPLGGESIWGAIGDVVREDKGSVMITTHIDSNAVFHDLTFGAASAASGIIAVLGAVNALEPHRAELAGLNRQILVGLFQGEQWERLGSRRFVFDVSNGCALEKDGKCKSPYASTLEWTSVNLSNINDVVAVDQVGGYFANVASLYTHVSDSSNLRSGTLAAELQAQGGTVGLSVSPGQQSPPPSPLSSFLESDLFSGGGVVFSAYNKSFDEVNPLYQSRFEKASTNVTAQLRDIATVIARTAFTRASEGQTPGISALDIEADFETIRQLEFCLTVDFACDLVAEYFNTTTEVVRGAQSSDIKTNRRPDGEALPPLFYTSIFTPQTRITSNKEKESFPSPTLLESFIRVFVADNSKPVQPTVEGTCRSDSDCINNFQGVVTCNDTFPTSLACVRRKCICSSIHFHHAYSPSLLMDIDDSGVAEYEILQNGVDTLVWLEPRYELPNLKLFQMSDNRTSVQMMILAALFTLSTYVLLSVLISRLKNTKYHLD